MKIEEIADLLKPNTQITKSEYEKIVHQFSPECSQDAIYWQLRKLQKKGIIKKIGRGIYTVCDNEKEKWEYTYEHSELMEEIVERIEKEYPLLDFQVWEFIQLNEFVNHLIGKNVIFIEVERMLEETVFEMLSKHYPRVLLCPEQELFYTYFQENMIVVQKLLTEAPKPIQGTKSSCLEKILVDLFSNKLTGQLIQGAEYPLVFEEAFSKFYIDEIKLMRYARRRNLETKIRDFIRQETNIQLHTEEINAKHKKL